MHAVQIRCVDLGLVALPTAVYLQGYTLFLSFKVHVCCDSAVDFTGKLKKVVSVVVTLKIEVVHDFYVTKQRISISLGVCRLLGCSKRAPFAALWILIDGGLRMNCIAAQNQTFASYLSLKLSVLRKASTSRRPSLKSPCRLPFLRARILQRKKQSRPDVRLHVGSSYGSVDPDVLTAKGQCHTTKLHVTHPVW